MKEIHLPVSVSSIPFFAEWTGVWSILPAAAAQLSALVERMDIVSHLASVQAAAAAAPGKQVSRLRTDYGPVAVLAINGVLMKQQASIGDNTSTVMLRQEVRKIANDSSVGAVLLNIDSPGGSTGGLDQLANDIAKLSCPVHAFANDLCCSAAYLLACCASNITSERSATLGSIGTYSTVIDSSVAAAQAGIKVLNITNEKGVYKGLGTPGTAVTDQQIAMVKSMVQDVQSRFDERVSTGRKIPIAKAQSLATGEVWSGTSAKTQGLIDAIGTWDDALAKVSQAAQEFLANGRRSPPSAGTKQESSTMSEDSQVIISRFNALITAEKQQGHNHQAALRRVCVKHPGLHRAYIEATNSVSGSVATSITSDITGGRKQAIEAYNSAIDETMKSRNCDRPTAQRIVNREQAAIRDAYIAACN